jgi:3'-5' exoribonuclease Rv2179c-like domain
MLHNMLFLETLDISGTSALLSLVIIPFNLKTGEVYSGFYQKIHLQSCLDVGLTVSASPFYFWLKQSDDARLELLDDRLDLTQVLLNLSQWLTLSGGYGNWLWANPNTFDVTILKNAYKACKLTFPIHPSKVNDVQTIYNNIKILGLEGFKKHPCIAAYDAHAECLRQVKDLCLAWRMLYL